MSMQPMVPAPVLETPLETALRVRRVLARLVVGPPPPRPRPTTKRPPSR